MRVDLFDFDLPDDRIALQPVSPRDAARMLVVDASGQLHHAGVRDLTTWLKPGDALVLNDTRVLPAALEGVRWRGDQSAQVDFNLIKRVDGARWRAFARPAKRLLEGDAIVFAKGDAAPLNATLSGKHEAGEVELAFDVADAALDAAIAAVGAMPLPPYIALKRDAAASDAESYQTVYAKKTGAVAAPTAGLHMTDALLAALKARCVSQHFVTLHVGAGTFLPVKADDTRDHKMHAEWGEVTDETASALRAIQARGGRIVAVGTTALRLIESAAASGSIQPFRGETAIFITPGYRFRAIDALMTNFHLPRSTLFMLVSALAGQETMRHAYATAIAERYRFYSYGDASLLFHRDVGTES